MSYSAPLEFLTDATGSITFGWLDEGVYYARFSRCLSAKLGDAFASRLRAALQNGGSIKYFGDGRALESYDLLARSAFVRVVSEYRSRFAQITLLTWGEGEVGDATLSALGQPTKIAKDANEFDASLYATAPRASYKLDAKAEARQRLRSPLRR